MNARVSHNRRSSPTWRARSLGVSLAIFSTAIGGLARTGAAQTASSAGVVLRLHPRVGDTLHTRLEQSTEITSANTAGASARPVTTKVTVLARTIVQASRQATTTVLTVVDSAEVHSSDAHGTAMSAQAEKVLRGQRMVVEAQHVAELNLPDGSAERRRQRRSG